MSEQMKTFISGLALFLVILLLVFLLAVLTPKIARFVDSIIDRLFRKVPKEKDENLYKVRGIYDLPADRTEPEQEKNIEKDGIEENGKE